jgi:hypothetical protein
VSTPTPIRIDACVDPAEHPALVAGAEQLGECLLVATGVAWPVQVRLLAPGSTPLPPAGALAFTIFSLLPETQRLDEPIAVTDRRWRDTLRPFVERGSAVFVCTVFRSTGEPSTAAGAASALLERIRRLNLLAVELSHALGVWVIDFDRALAHVGARALQSDYRLGGRLAAEVAGHQIVWSLLAHGLDDGVSPQAQETAKTFHGDLQRIDALIRRRLARHARSAGHG